MRSACWAGSIVPLDETVCRSVLDVATAATPGPQATPVAAEPARMRIVYSPDSTITSTSATRFSHSEYDSVVTR